MEKEHLLDRKQNNQYTIEKDENGAHRYQCEATRDRENEPVNKSAASAGMSQDTYSKAKYILKHASEEDKHALMNNQKKIWKKSKERRRKYGQISVRINSRSS